MEIVISNITDVAAHELADTVGRVASMEGHSGLYLITLRTLFIAIRKSATIRGILRDWIQRCDEQ